MVIRVVRMAQISILYRHRQLFAFASNNICLCKLIYFISITIFILYSYQKRICVCLRVKSFFGFKVIFRVSQLFTDHTAVG